MRQGDLTSADPKMSLRNRLRAETRSEHEEIERALDLMRPDFTLDDYRALIARHYAFHLPFESLLGSLAAQGDELARFYRKRCKSGWLVADLRAVDVEKVEATVCLAVERLHRLYPNPARLIGAFYVIEGSMLGGALLARHFGKTLRLSPERGLRFFTGYGELSGRRWGETLRLLETHEAARSAEGEVVAGARATFLLLKEHLAP